MKTAEEWFQTTQVRFGAAGGATSNNNAAARGIAYHKRIYRLLGIHFAVSLRGWSFQAEPWFRARESRKLCSPDGLALLLDGAHVRSALVIEVKLNWKDGRDGKLLDLYVPVVSNVFDIKAKPLLITRNVRGLQHEPLVGLSQLPSVADWRPGDPTPVMLIP